MTGSRSSARPKFATGVSPSRAGKDVLGLGVGLVPGLALDVPDDPVEPLDPVPDEPVLLVELPEPELGVGLGVLFAAALCATRPGMAPFCAAIAVAARSA